jgi:hypothetical protein
MLKLAREIQEEEAWLKADAEARQHSRRRALEFDGRVATAATPTPTPALAPWPPVIPENASAEEVELAELVEMDHAEARRHARIAELERLVAAKRRQPRLAAVKELWRVRGNAVALAERQPEHVKAKLAECIANGTVRLDDDATRAQDVLVALAIIADCTSLLEAVQTQALVTEALGENVARLGGQLLRDRIALGQRKVALEGRTRNPHMRSTLTVERSWLPLLSVARGETEK